MTSMAQGLVGPAARTWRRAVAAALVGVAMATTGVGAAPIVTTDQPVYTVKPNQAFTVEVLIDAELGLPGIQTLEAGLFSNGWQMTFDATKATVDLLTVEPALDFFAFLPGANTDVGPGFVEAEGNIDQIANQPYFGARLATIELTNLAPRGEMYFLQLALKQHFPTEQLFLDGDGVVLDSRLLFGSAKVIVIPEPASLVLAGLALLGLAAVAIGRRR